MCEMLDETSEKDSNKTSQWDKDRRKEKKVLI